MLNKFAANVLLLWAIALSSLPTLAGAGADTERSGGRDDQRESRQSARSEKGTRPDSREPLPGHMTQSFAPIPSAQQSPPVQQAPNAAGIQDSGRRQGKMSPEERRALRQQIDQASHELYPLSR